MVTLEFESRGQRLRIAEITDTTSSSERQNLFNLDGTTQSS